MKRLTLLLLAAFLVMAATPLRSNAQRSIKTISVTFNTTSDDKDHDTYLRCQILTPDDHWLASNEGQFGHFPDGGTYTLFLNMGAPDYSSSLLSQSRLYVGIWPNGNDTWNFRWQVTVTYWDGSQSTSSGTGGLDQDDNAFKLVIFN